MVFSEKRATFLLHPLVICFVLSYFIVKAAGIDNVRLTGSTVPLEGRVEVYRQGEWGRVCMKGWLDSTHNLDVVCRELGFSKGVAVTTKYPGTKRVWLYEVGCTGNEETITSCYHVTKGLTEQYCPDNQDVSVHCEMCDQPIISNANLVHDWFFTATSYKATNPPHYARIRSTAAWCLHPMEEPSVSNYLEIELPRLYLVTAVATLGGLTGADYVKSYFIQYRAENNDWNQVIVAQKSEIQGNSASGNENVVKRVFDSAIRAKFMRFYPLSWGSMACMRIEICGRQLPHKPTILLRQTSATSIVISWSKPDPGEDVVQEYYVRYWRVKEGERSQKLTKTSTTASVLTSLAPATTYEIQVAATSNIGEGWRASYITRTNEAAPSGPPTNIKGTFVGTTAVNITWAPPREDQRNGKITGYTVMLCGPETANLYRSTTDNCQNGVAAVKDPVPKLWYVVRDIDLTKRHVIQIRAYTAHGAGPRDEIITDVLQFNPPDEKIIGIVIAVIATLILLGFGTIIVLALRGIILKNFLSSLRKLTRSQTILSPRHSNEVEAPWYDKPDETPNNPKKPSVDKLSNTSNVSLAAVSATNDTYETTRNTREALTTADDIYQAAHGMSQNSSFVPLYEPRNENVVMHSQTSETLIQQVNNQEHVNEQESHEQENFAPDQDQFAREQGDFARDQDTFARKQGNFARDQDKFAREQGDFARDEDVFPHDQGDFARDQDEFAHEQGDFARDEDVFPHDQGDFARDQDEFAREQGGFVGEQGFEHRLSVESSALEDFEAAYGKLEELFEHTTISIPQPQTSSINNFRDNENQQNTQDVNALQPVGSMELSSSFNEFGEYGTDEAHEQIMFPHRMTRDGGDSSMTRPNVVT